MSIHSKALLFMGWSLCVLLSTQTWMTYLRDVFGQLGTLFGVAVWLAHGGIAMWLFRCPVCGTSMFSSGKGGLVVRTPWPRRVCGHCGYDLAR